MTHALRDETWVAKRRTKTHHHFNSVACTCAVQYRAGSIPGLARARPRAPPPDSGRECECRGVIRRSLDCSDRERSQFSTSELCAGRTHKVDLSRNNFVAFPTAWGSYVTQVNVSRNRLTALPRAPPLNAGTVWLDVSENQIGYASDELRGLQSLEKLYVGGNRLRTLGFLPSPCALTKLSAPRNLLTALDGALARCAELESLDLSNNQILSLPRVALDGLNKLEKLKLHGAGLVNIEEGSFHDLVKLELLDLSDNDLTTLPSGLFTTLHELDDLFLDNNSLTALPADAFVGLVELEVLSLTNNKITTLAPGAFTGLEDIKYLTLNENRLTTLPSNIFSGLPQVKGIDLSVNQLETLPSRLFADLTTLEKVKLHHNKLTTLPSDLFAGLSNLELVDLSHNQLSALPPGLVQPLTLIKSLDLSHNRFTTFSGRDLNGLHSVERLNLEFNLLTALPLYDASWPAVERAVFGHNNIVSAGEVTLRSWLGDGNTKRVVSVEGRPPLSTPSALQWALNDGALSTSTSEELGCACGAVKKGDAQVRFCLAAACPNVHATWVEAVRAAPAPQTHKG
ncbi:Toll-like receptor 7 [Gryllus bimaculatus]|nr:Toll-like receptor 7 [Gryllus bimaculatus]